MYRPSKNVNLSAWKICAIALASFAAGSFTTAHRMHIQQVEADSNRVFELNIYHAVPGKVPKLESRFRDASKLIARHNLNVLGYWVPNDDPAWKDTFIYLVAHSSKEEADKNWDAFHTDPGFQVYRRSENAEKLIERVDEIIMRPTDYSPMK